MFIRQDGRNNTNRSKHTHTQYKSNKKFKKYSNSNKCKIAKLAPQKLRPASSQQTTLSVQSHCNLTFQLFCSLRVVNVKNSFTLSKLGTEYTVKLVLFKSSMSRWTPTSTLLTSAARLLQCHQTFTMKNLQS